MFTHTHRGGGVIIYLVHDWRYELYYSVREKRIDKREWKRTVNEYKSHMGSLLIKDVCANFGEASSFRCLNKQRTVAALFHLFSENTTLRSSNPYVTCLVYNWDLHLMYIASWWEMLYHHNLDYPHLFWFILIVLIVSYFNE